MLTKPYKKPKNEQMKVAETAVEYQTATAVSSNSWNPNVPFVGTQEEWWDHFHRIEEGEFDTWEEHQKKFRAWKEKILTSHI